MGVITSEQLRRAEAKERAARLAAAQIEQAGRGLGAAINQCLTNTAGLPTVGILADVQAYIADALRLLVEVEVQSEPDCTSKLLVPR